MWFLYVLAAVIFYLTIRAIYYRLNPWMSNSYNAAYAAVMRLSSQKKLEKIVYKANHNEIRKKAFEKITDQNILGRIGCTSSEFSEAAFNKVSDSEIKKQIKSSKAWQEHKEYKKRISEVKKRHGEQSRLREERLAKRLCPNCGGRCSFQITTRMKNSNIAGYKAAESNNLEPVEEGKCRQCGHTFISKSPQEIQESWNRQNR